MPRIAIKPLSVNEAFKGRRFKTDKYTAYAKELSLRIKPFKLPDPPYEIHFKFGLSSKNADGDNCVKQAQDVIATKLGFNDKLIRKWIIEVETVKKGCEYLEFELTSLSRK